LKGNTDGTGTQCKSELFSYPQQDWFKTTMTTLGTFLLVRRSHNPLKAVVGEKEKMVYDRCQSGYVSNISNVVQNVRKEAMKIEPDSSIKYEGTEITETTVKCVITR